MEKFISPVYRVHLQALTSTTKTGLRHAPPIPYPLSKSLVGGGKNALGFLHLVCLSVWNAPCPGSGGGRGTGGEHNKSNAIKINHENKSRNNAIKITLGN